MPIDRLAAVSLSSYDSTFWYALTTTSSTINATNPGIAYVMMFTATSSGCRRRDTLLPLRLHEHVKGFKQND